MKSFFRNVKGSEGLALGGRKLEKVAVIFHYKLLCIVLLNNIYTSP